MKINFVRVTPPMGQRIPGTIELLADEVLPKDIEALTAPLPKT